VRLQRRSRASSPHLVQLSRAAGIATYSLSTLARHSLRSFSMLISMLAHLHHRPPPKLGTHGQKAPLPNRACCSAPSLSAPETVIRTAVYLVRKGTRLFTRQRLPPALPPCPSTIVASMCPHASAEAGASVLAHPACGRICQIRPVAWSPVRPVASSLPQTGKQRSSRSIHCCPAKDDPLRF
jgi:hypothetical protein